MNDEKVHGPSAQEDPSDSESPDLTPQVQDGTQGTPAEGQVDTDAGDVRPTRTPPEPGESDELGDSEQALREALDKYRKSKQHADAKITEQGQELAALRRELEQTRQALAQYQQQTFTPQIDDYDEAGLTNVPPQLGSRLSQIEQAQQVIAQSLLEIQESSRVLQESTEKERKLAALRAATGLESDEDVEALQSALDAGDYATFANAVALSKLKQQQVSEAQRRRRAEPAQAVAPGGSSSPGASGSRESQLLKQFQEIKDPRRRQQFLIENPDLIAKLG